jgi:hypothetical protein
MAEQQRTPRELETREKEPLRTVYTPPSTLPEPNPRPGLAHRWIATHIMGQADPTNVSKRLREGWVPVKAADYPELMLAASKSGNVEIGGLMLCVASAEFAKSREAYYNAQARGQMESVDNNFMRNSDPRMPLFAEKKSSTSRGKDSFGSGT